MNRRQLSWALTSIGILTAAMPMLGQILSFSTTKQSETSEQHPPEKGIHTRVVLVNSFITVMNAKGEFVRNLDSRDFQVTDNGVPQNVTFLDSGYAPLSLVILVETSSRIEPLLQEIRNTGILFADSLIGPDDEVAVVGFNDYVEHLQDFTTNHAVIQNTINELETRPGGSKLLDAMVTGLEMLTSRLEWQRATRLPDRRLVLVIMSEATDLGSEAPPDRVLRVAQLSNVTIYSVGIPTTLVELLAPPKDVRPKNQPNGIFALPAMPGTVQIQSTEDIRNGYGNLMNLNVWALRNTRDLMDGHVLNLAASGTGGRHIATFGGRSIENAVDEIGAELHSQYWLAYEPKGTEEAGYHTIKVHMKRKGLKARARPGYYIAP